jgi:hypothetical protein
MRPAKKVLVAGLLIYLLSFALPAARNVSLGSGALPGFLCAFLALSFPWDHTNMQNHFQGLLPDLEWTSLALSGWINPIFLAAMVCSKRPLIFPTLRIVLIAMLPSCWIVFHTEDFYPREGYFLWVAGMLLALFSADKQ